MAKTNIQVKEESQLPATTQLDDMMREDAGRGVSRDAADNLVPQIKVMQPLSPEIENNQGNPGDFLLEGKFVSGSIGIWFQPCAFIQMWLEFQPLVQGGGFVASHVFTTEDVLPAGASKVDRFKVRMKNGNEVIHYRQLAGIVWDKSIPLEYVIAFKSTGHTIAREWNTRAGRLNRFTDGTPRALFAHVYHLTTSRRENAQGKWYVIDVGQGLLLGSPEATELIGDGRRAYQIGRSLASAFETGEKAAKVESERHLEDAM